MCWSITFVYYIKEYRNYSSVIFISRLSPFNSFLDLSSLWKIRPQYIWTLRTPGYDLRPTTNNNNNNNTKIKNYTSTDNIFRKRIYLDTLYTKLKGNTCCGISVFLGSMVVFLECIYLILPGNLDSIVIVLPFPKFVHIWLKAVQAITRLEDITWQVVPVMNCSLAKDASPQIKPASSHEHFYCGIWCCC